MTTIDCKNMPFDELNERVRTCRDHDITLDGALGQRYIGCGLGNKDITIVGTPGNALGAYLGGANITVLGNAQDATGDTMNDGKITVFGRAGDTVGYAMRGGEILIRGDAGFRIGIHMKEYGSQVPRIVIGGKAGDFLGEYQAGGVIVVLGLNNDDNCNKNDNCNEHNNVCRDSGNVCNKNDNCNINDNICPVGAYCATGQYGGKIYIRSTVAPDALPPQTDVDMHADITEILPLLRDYATTFGADYDALATANYIRLTPSTSNIYKRLYTNRNM